MGPNRARSTALASPLSSSSAVSSWTSQKVCVAVTGKKPSGSNSLRGACSEQRSGAASSSSCESLSPWLLSEA